MTILKAKKNIISDPSLDGGYNLTGFKKDLPVSEVFEGISFNTGGEFDEKMKEFNKIGGLYV